MVTKCSYSKDVSVGDTSISSIIDYLVCGDTAGGMGRREEGE